MTYWLCTRDKLSGPTTNVHSEFIKTENDRLTHLKTDDRLHMDQGEGDRSRHGIPTDGVRIVAPSVTLGGGGNDNNKNTQEHDFLA